MELTAFDVRYLVQELQLLVGAHIQQVYDGVYVQAYQKNTGKLFLRITESAAWIAPERTQIREKPTNFCSALRKHLTGLTIKKIEQVESERIILITVASKETTRVLVIELFGNGNLLVLDEEDAILTGKTLRAWKDRALKRKQRYELPPVKKNLFTLTQPDLAFEKKRVSQQLALLGFGKNYAHELCKRAKIDPEETSLLPAEQQRLYTAYQTLLAEPLAPHIYSGFASPIKLDLEGIAAKTFSEAIQQLYREPEEPKDLVKEKLLKRLAMQEASVKKLEEQAREAQRVGETIYEKYQEIKMILDELNELSKKHSLQDIKKKLKDHPVVKDIDPKTSNFVIDL